MASKALEIGPYTRALHRGTLDGRSREARAHAEIRASLIQELGGDEAMTLRVLGIIESIARSEVVARLLFTRICNDPAFAATNLKWHMAVENSLTRNYTKLGIERRQRPAPSLSDILSAEGATA